MDLGLQFLGFGALEGLVILIGFAQNTVQYLAPDIAHRVQMIVIRYSLTQYGD